MTLARIEQPLAVNRSAIEMFDLADSELIKIATFVLALVVALSFFRPRKKNSRPKRETVHVATANEIRKLRSQGRRADGRIVEVRDGSPRASDDVSPVMVHYLANPLFAITLDLLFWTFQRLPKRPSDAAPTPPPVKLTGATYSAATYLLYEFEVLEEGRARTFRGAQRFHGEPYLAVGKVGETSKVTFLPQDPSISTIHAERVC